MIRQVLQLGDPVLRTVAPDVKNLHQAGVGLDILLQDMIETMRATGGVGIAAPQIGVSLRVFVIEVRDEDRYRGAKPYPLTIAINPKLKLVGPLLQSWEGCLSVRGLRGRLPRNSEAVISFLDADLEPRELHLTGFPAIVAQHETDHLEGMVYLDRMPDLSTLCFEEHYHANVVSLNDEAIGEPSV